MYLLTSSPFTNALFFGILFLPHAIWWLRQLFMERYIGSRSIDYDELISFSFLIPVFILIQGGFPGDGMSFYGIVLVVTGSLGIGYVISRLTFNHGARLFVTKNIPKTKVLNKIELTMEGRGYEVKRTESEILLSDGIWSFYVAEIPFNKCDIYFQNANDFSGLNEIAHEIKRRLEDTSGGLSYEAILGLSFISVIQVLILLGYLPI